MLRRVRGRETWYTVVAEEREQANCGSFLGLELALGVTAGLMVAAVVLMPGLLGLLAVFIVFTLALLGNLLVQAARDRQPAAPTAPADVQRLTTERPSGQQSKRAA